MFSLNSLLLWFWRTCSEIQAKEEALALLGCLPLLNNFMINELVEAQDVLFDDICCFPILRVLRCIPRYIILLCINMVMYCLLFYTLIPFLSSLSFLCRWVCILYICTPDWNYLWFVLIFWRINVYMKSLFSTIYIYIYDEDYQTK